MGLCEDGHQETKHQKGLSKSSAGADNPTYRATELAYPNFLAFVESDQSNLVGNFDLLGVVSSCLPAGLVSVVRPPCDLYIYTSTYTNYDFKH